MCTILQLLRDCCVRLSHQALIKIQSRVQTCGVFIIWLQRVYEPCDADTLLSARYLSWSFLCCKEHQSFGIDSVCVCTQVCSSAFTSKSCFVYSCSLCTPSRAMCTILQILRDCCVWGLLQHALRYHWCGL